MFFIQKPKDQEVKGTYDGVPVLQIFMIFTDYIINKMLQARNSLDSYLPESSNFKSLIKIFLSQFGQIKNQMPKSYVNSEQESADEGEHTNEHLNSDQQNINQFKVNYYNPKKNQDMQLQHRTPGKKISIAWKNSNTTDDQNRKSKKDITNLQKQIKKKDELIRYLERKCGEQIIKSTAKIYKRINQLQCENERLTQEIANLSWRDSNITKLTDNKSQQRLQTGQLKILQYQTLNQSELRKLIFLQSNQIKGLVNKLEQRDEKLMQYGKSNKQLRKTLAQKIQQLNQNPSIINKSHRKSFSLNKKDFLDAVFDQNTPDSMSKINILNNSIESFASENYKDTSLSSSQQVDDKIRNRSQRGVKMFGMKNIDNRIKKNCISSSVQTNNIEIKDIELQTQQDQASIILRQQNNQLKQKNKKLEDEIRDLNSQLSCFKQKLQICYNNIDDMHFISPTKTDQQFRSQEVYQPQNQIQHNYFELLDIFGIQWQQYQSTHEVHQMLLTEINNLKKQLGKMLKQFRKLQKQMEKLYDQKTIYQRKLEQEKCINIGMNDFIGYLTNQLQNSNEEIMRNMILRYNDRFCQDQLNQLEVSTPSSIQLKSHRKTSPQQQQKLSDDGEQKINQIMA